MKRLLAILAGLGLAGIAGIYALVLFNGPRMRVQQHVRAFQAVLPQVPPGTIPVPDEPLRKQSAALSDRDALAAGMVYYRYYCVFCHGERGDGTGPVGQSYQPVPANLSAGRLREYDDRKLLNAMLTGIGHEPVLKRVVDPEHYTSLVRYVRSLSESTGRVRR